ncbi:hypothetical protein Q4Q35_13785 [Flavivirga aquimarina]|uniref:Uncharacterized protein n=1 Tax=Flavivirga aquimarina TaxID=2027862 RepID=A0ABT8WCK7_9FLAO|nr:hypothetical protein [Flavivirga aquimarina]MDO5970879.1 hypothetical protein [Flavivirga aquimarina]
MKKLVLETIQHSTLKDIDDVDPICDKDHEVLEEVRQILSKHKYTDRFGLILLHKHFDIATDEMLLEETDVENKVSTVRVEKAKGTEINTIETMWKFSEDIKAGTRCVLRCNYNSGHKAYHSKEKV